MSETHLKGPTGATAQGFDDAFRQRGLHCRSVINPAAACRCFMLFITNTSPAVDQVFFSDCSEQKKLPAIIFTSYDKVKKMSNVRNPVEQIRIPS